MIGAALTFGAALGGEANEPLRARLSALAGAHAGTPARADTVLGAYARLAREGEDGEPPTRHLLLDPHRWVLFDEEAEEGAPRLGSVVRYLVDDYPLRPIARMLRAAGEPYRFLYPLAALDLLEHLWPTLRPGAVVVGDLVTGEVRVESAVPHPRARRRALPAAPAPPPPLRFEERPTDASLRAETAPNLKGLVALAAGVVRERIDTASHPSLPYALARLAWGGETEYCSAKALRPAEAGAVALCEAVERFHVAFVPPDEALVRARRAELGDRAVDPRALFLGPPPPAGGSALERYDDERPLHWTWATDLRLRQSVLVPAQEVWFNAAPGQPRYASTTTSGSALGGSVEEAGVFAFLEAVERDAYLTAWYLRRPCPRIDPGTVRHESFQLLARRWRHAYPGYEFFLFDCTTDIAIPSVAAVAVRRRGTGPMTFHAAAARLSVERACFAALKDLAGFSPVLTPERRAELLPLLQDPDRVQGPEDHFGLYSLDESFERLGFLDFRPGPGIDAHEVAERAWFPARPRTDLRAVLEESAERMHPLGVSLLLKDVTHAAFAGRHMRCVRAVTPGLFPMWFGNGWRRLALTERLHRLAWELAGREISGPEDLNLELHPFS